MTTNLKDLAFWDKIELKIVATQQKSVKSSEKEHNSLALETIEEDKDLDSLQEGDSAEDSEDDQE